MTFFFSRRSVTVISLLIPTLGLGVAAGAESASPTAATRSSAGAAQRPATTRTTSTRAVLPDPALLDGSKQAAEKKSEYGMIGDFELPGDENAKTGRVGGAQQNPGEQQSQNGGGLPQSGAGGAPGMPQPGGKPDGGQQTVAQSQPGGGAQTENAKPGGPAGAGDPNAKAEGIQVAQLGGEPSGSQPPGSADGKPPPVAIGDSAMRIQTSANTPGVVGQQQIATNTQVYEKGTGTGGKGPTAPGGVNRTEKGRAIPAGL